MVYPLNHKRKLRKCSLRTALLPWTNQVCLLSVGGHSPRAPLRKGPRARGHGLLMVKGPRLLMVKGPRLLLSYSATLSGHFKLPRSMGTEHDLISYPRTFTKLFSSYRFSWEEQRKKLKEWSMKRKNERINMKETKSKTEMKKDWREERTRKKDRKTK